MKGPALSPSRFATVSEALASAARSPTGVTFVGLDEEESTLSWDSLLTRARYFAGALRARGVRRGDRVALVLPTSPDFLDAFFGALLVGAIPVPLYPPVRLGRLPEYHRATARMLRAVDAALVVSEPHIGRLLGQAIEAARPRFGLEIAAALREGSPGEWEERTSGDALALIQFSSGSTVDPKPVALTHANLVSQCQALEMAVGKSEEREDVGVCWLPLYHDMGLIGCLVLAAYWPGKLVLLSPEHFVAKPSLWLRAIGRHRATLSAAPNFAYALCARRVQDVDLAGLSLASWRAALNGAEPVAPTVLDRFVGRFARFGFRSEALRPVYGLSEATLAVTFAPSRPHPLRRGVDPQRLAASGEVADGRRKVAAVGVPVPGVEVEIRDEDGAPQRERRLGSVFVRGPSVMHGYFGAPQASARVLSAGWLDTGDLGFVDGAELYITGRAKDLVVLRGANHAPQEFEDCLDELPGLRAGCAIALGFVPEEGDGEALLILAERVHGADEASLAAAISERIATQTGISPHTVRVLEPGTLPRTSSGKLRRAEALRRHLAGELIPPRAVNLLTVGAELLRSTLAFQRVRRP